jgi:hypothetical protein
MGRIPKHSASEAAPVDAGDTPLANWVGAVWKASAHRCPTGIIEERDEQNLAAIAPGASSGNEGACSFEKVATHFAKMFPLILVSRFVGIAKMVNAPGFWY